ADAYPAWKEVVKVCPKTSLNTYIRGNAILKTMIAKEQNPTKKEAYIAELLALWDLRAQNYGSEGYCLGMKARDMRTYHPKKIKEAHALYQAALEHSNDKAFFPIAFFYLENVVEGVKAGVLDKALIFDAYEQAAGVLETLITNYPTDTNISNTQKQLDIIFEPYAACSDLIPIYEKKFEEHKLDASFLKKATKMLDYKNCTDAPIFFRATQALHAIDPTPETAYLMGKMTYAKKNYSATIKYLESQIESIAKKNEKVSAYLLLANSYLNLGSYSACRNMANQALALDPNEGKAYLIIGNAYASSARACGDEPLVAQKAGYWAAVDKLNKAKSVDPSVADQANQLINIYRSNFPSGDDLFYFGLSEGGSYRIGCWIGESTVIRAR
ncbi:MAG: hypothetical protein RR190_05340, partial [Bacteroidales bacterium]